VKFGASSARDAAGGGGPGSKSNMTQRTAATRYARALLDVAAKEAADLEKVGQELDDFIALVHQHQALDRLLLNPAVPASRKRATMDELTRLAGVSPVVSKLLVLLAERDRLVLLNDLAASYREILMDRQQVVRAEVTSASPLGPEKTRAIEARLAALSGRRVLMVTKVDKDILGGVVARVGSTVYDASIATQLRRIRERLTT
jgi:F-type H+-transporting ATPase subunit delta